MNKLQTVRDALEGMAQEPVAWADDNAMQGKVGKVCSTAAKRYWEKSDWVDKKNAELHKYPLYAAPVAVQAVPAGWQLVPVEPTPEMVNAGRTTPVPSDIEWDEDEDYRAVYKAMLAAAPKGVV